VSGVFGKVAVRRQALVAFVALRHGKCDALAGRRVEHARGEGAGQAEIALQKGWAEQLPNRSVRSAPPALRLLAPDPARLALNEGHRFHHLKWAGIGDVNFGLFTLVWDHLLGTYSYTHERRFTGDQLGMAAKPNYPIAYMAQLAEPFRASGACQSKPD